MVESKPVLLLLLLVVLVASLNTSNSLSSEPDTIVGVFYYPWYEEGNQTLHWNQTLYNDTTVVDKPVLGWYDCANETVIRQQLDWMTYAGIDFVIISWWGWGPANTVDSAVQKIFETTNSSFPQMKLAIMVEDFNGSGQYDFAEIHSHILNEYIAKYDTVYFKLNGRPVICWWNAPNTTDNEVNRAEIVKENRTEIRIIGHRYDYVNWTAWNPNTVDVDPRNATRISESDGFTCIEPRYDNSYLDWIHKGRKVAEDQDLSAGLYDVQWQSVITQAALGSVRIVAIYSWNEFHERSQIEPCSSNHADQYYLLNRTKYYTDLIKGRFESVPWASSTIPNETIDITSNSVLYGLSVDENEGRISFNVTGDSLTKGFCIIRISNQFSEQKWMGNCTVLFDGTPCNFSEHSDTNSTYLLVNYAHTTHTIEVITELLPPFVFPSLMAATLLAAIVKKKIHSY